MNWFTLLGLLPYVIAGVDAIHRDAPGTSKLQKVRQLFGLASAGAVAVLPPDQAAIAQVAGDSADATIGAIVARMNDKGILTHKTPAAAL